MKHGIFLMAVVLILAACNPNMPQPTTTPIPSFTPSPIPTQTQTPAPTETPTPEIVEYPVCKPDSLESIKRCEITEDELFGPYFDWLEQEAKKLSCGPNMRTDVPMVDYGDYIIPDMSNVPNFSIKGTEFFIRDYTSAFVRKTLPDGQEVHYMALPQFICDLNDRTKVYPILTVFSAYDPGTQRSQDEDNFLWLSDSLKRWHNDMNITPIIRSSEMSGSRRGVKDPLVARTFEENLNMNDQFIKFVKGDFSALSNRGIVLLTHITSNKAHWYE